MKKENNKEVFQCVCGKQFESKRSLGIHKQSCQKYLESINQIQHEYKCSGCGRIFKKRASLQSHLRFCNNYTRQPPKTLHSSKYWNKEKQKYICECGREFDKYQSLNAHFSVCLIHKEAIGVEVKIAESRIRSGDKCNFSKAFLGEDKLKAMQEKSRQTLENNIKSGKTNKITSSLRFKCGWYKGFYCDSSWELAFVIYCLDHNLPIKRCRQCLRYEFEGEIHRYYPDFEINDKIYEIKGRENEKTQAKQKQFPDIIILRYKEMLPILSYVKEKYGKDFIKLYEPEK